MKIWIEGNQILLKRAFLILYDALAVVAASLLALLIRYEGHVIEIPRIYVHKSLQYIPVIIIVTVVIFYGFQ